MITLADQIHEAQRELALRKRAYPKQVKRGTLTEGQAAYHLAVMQAIIATLRQLDMDQKQLHLFRETSRPSMVPQRIPWSHRKNGVSFHSP